MNPETDTVIHQMNAHLSQFKEMEFRARARLERLAELSLEIEDKLKLKEFAERVNELFDVSNEFESKLEALISDYEIERNRIESQGQAA